MTPYEEINELISIMQAAKETLEGTDMEYFTEEQLTSLNELSNGLAKTSLAMLLALGTFEDE